MEMSGQKRNVNVGRIGGAVFGANAGAIKGAVNGSIKHAIGSAAKYFGWTK